MYHPVGYEEITCYSEHMRQHWLRLVGVGLGLGLFVLPSMAAALSETHELILRSDGTLLVDGQPTVRVQAGVDLDHLTWVAVDAPNQRIDTVTATLHLPLPFLGDPSAFKLLGIKGVGSTSTQVVDAQTVVFQATAIEPTATLSILADFPTGYLMLPAAAQASVVIQEQSQLWLLSSLLLPAFGLFVLGYMGYQRLVDRRLPTGVPPQPTLAQPLPAALVSILYEDKIEPEAIAATLIDLGQRGYLSIYNKASNFIIAKERDIDLATPSFQVGDHRVQLSSEELAICAKEGLQPYEKILLSKLFVAARPISSKEDVKVRIGHGLFSRKVAAIYEYLFVDASDRGFFVPHAAKVHQHYLLAGWLLFTLGLGGFVAGAVTLPDPKYFLLFWAMLVGIGYLVVRLAPSVPLRTAPGRITLGEFLAHRAYLTTEEPVPATAGVDLFLAHLATAWALRAERAWAKRFSRTVFRRPGWYFTTRQLDTATQFIDDLDHLVSFVAESFSTVRQKTLA